MPPSLSQPAPESESESESESENARARLTILAPPEAAGQRVDRFLAAAFPAFSRARIQALIAAGAARCGDSVLHDAAAPVRAGQRYTLAPPPPVPARPEPQAIPFPILFEDEELLVLDKPAGLVVHPAPGNQDGTLVNALLAHCGADFAGIGGERRPGIVHRLDKDTSGVMVVAKNEWMMARLGEIFATRALERAYLALAWGLPAPAVGSIEGAIGRDPRDRKRMAVRAAGGKPALTHYHLRESWFGAVSLLGCRLATGRTHQIRVHLAASGHPLIGDPLYLRRVPGAAKAVPADLRARLLDFPRQALHAAELGFIHPRSGAKLAFAAPPPADFLALLGLLAEGRNS